jgi:hypothetical protein
MRKDKQLFSIEEIDGQACTEVREEIDVNDFYLFPQVRGEEPEEIDVTDLMPSLIAQGMINVPEVAVFNRQGFYEYIELGNDLHDANVVPGEYPPNYGDYWLVLVYGHRRTMACRGIHAQFQDQWIEDCSVPKGKDFLRKLKIGVLPVDFIANPPAKVAKMRQLQENCFQPVAPYKEARIIGEMFRLEKRYNEKITVAEFCRQMGGKLGEERVRNALKFYDSPKIIQEAAFQKVIGYGIAVQIGRYLKEVCPDDPEDKALELLGKAINSQPTTGAFTAFISESIRYAMGNLGQLDMMEIMNASFGISEKTKRGLQDGTRNSLERIVLHLRGMIFLWEKGLLTLADSPFLQDSNAKLLLRTMKEMERAHAQFLKLLELVERPGIPHLKRLNRLASQIERSRAGESISTALSLATRLAELVETA